jgi:hypothetical protein
MRDDELRAMFSQWAQPLRAAAPPPVTAIRRRARARAARMSASTLAVIALVAAGAIQATHVLGAGNGPGAVTSPTPSSATHKAGRISPYWVAPYYVAGLSHDNGAGVYNAVLRTRIALISAPHETSAIGHYATFFAAIAAAGDDRTFVLAAIANTNSLKAAPVWLFRIHLTASGMPGPLVPLHVRHEQQGITGHWFENIASMALTSDGTELAIATNRSYGDRNGPADIEVINLATGATRTWTSTPQDISSLSWAGDHTIAFACDGVCVLDTAKPGSSLSQARLVIPWKTRYRGMQTEQWPMITPDGSAIYAAMDGGGLGLVEFSATTGKPLRLVMGPVATDSNFCGVLWSNPAGRHLIATCNWDTPAGTPSQPDFGNPVLPSVTGTITDGHFTKGPNLPPRAIEYDESGAGGFVIGW